MRGTGAKKDQQGQFKTSTGMEWHTPPKSDETLRFSGHDPSCESEYVSYADYMKCDSEYARAQPPLRTGCGCRERIHALPDLLAALKLIVDSHDRCCDCDGSCVIPGIEMARAAIDRAEGRR